MRLGGIVLLACVLLGCKNDALVLKPEEACRKLEDYAAKEYSEFPMSVSILPPDPLFGTSEGENERMLDAVTVGFGDKISELRKREYTMALQDHSRLDRATDCKELIKLASSTRQQQDDRNRSEIKPIDPELFMGSPIVDHDLGIALFEVRRTCGSKCADGGFMRYKREPDGTWRQDDFVTYWTT